MGHAQRGKADWVARARSPATEVARLHDRTVAASLRLLSLARLAGPPLRDPVMAPPLARTSGAPVAISGASVRELGCASRTNEERQAPEVRSRRPRVGGEADVGASAHPELAGPRERREERAAKPRRPKERRETSSSLSARLDNHFRGRRLGATRELRMPRPVVARGRVRPCHAGAVHPFREEKVLARSETRASPRAAAHLLLGRDE